MQLPIAYSNGFVKREPMQDTFIQLCQMMEVCIQSGLDFKKNLIHISEKNCGLKKKNIGVDFVSSFC